MVTHLYLRSLHLAFFAVVIFSSCSNDKSRKAEKTTPDSANTVVATGTPQGNTIFGGQLDTLLVDSSAFTTAGNQQLVFAFTFRDKDTLTLHGWSSTGNSSKPYDSLPNIMLTKGPASGLSYGPGTYFGNVLLSTSEIVKIRNKLNSENAQLVVFAPAKYGEHVQYKILVAKKDPALDKAFLLAVPTGAFANPSPPK